MKKKTILWGILSVLVIFMTTGCGKKDVLTTDSFSSISKNNDCAIYDISEQYAVYEEIEEATVALNDDGWQIEFYVLTDSEEASSMFLTNKTTFESYKSNSSAELKTAMGNYETYALTSGGYYMYVSRVDNTLLYLRVDDKYKDTVKSLVEELGY